MQLSLCLIRGFLTRKYKWANVILFVLLAFQVTLQAQANPTWTIQTVDNKAYGYGNGYSPIVLDSNNIPHIVYTNIRIEPNRFQTPLVMYASWDGKGWNSEQIAIGVAFSLLIDSNNNPQILYGGYSGHEGLIYASWTGKEWTNQTIDETFWNGHGSFALDSFGNPHIAYTSRYVENGTYRLNYGSWTGSDWSIQTFDKSEDIRFRTSIAIDKNNVIYLMYGYTTKHYSSYGSYWESQTVKLAINENSNWKTGIVVSNITNYSNMVLDSQNFPHFAYQVKVRGNPWTSNISYASWDGSGWNTQTIVSNVSLKVDFVNINMGGLALDAYGYPHIDYVITNSNPNSDLCSVMYASWTGREWDIQTVDSAHIANGPCYLSVDSNGNPHISYLITPTGVGLDSYIASVVYATATETTQTSSPTFPFSAAVAVITAVIIGTVVTVVGVLFYFKKRKH